MVGSYRRYCLAKRISHRGTALENVWSAKHQAASGAPLPPLFPGREELVAAGYSAVDDVREASVRELMDVAALTPADAEAAKFAAEA